MYKYLTMSKITSREDYYFHNGSFFLKNKWAKKIRTGIIFALFIIGSFVSANAMFNNHSMVRIPLTFSSEFSALVQFVKTQNNKLSESEAIDIVNSLKKWSEKFNVDYKLLLALVKVESTFRLDAISETGAMGLMQVIPSWHIDKIRAARSEVGTPELFNIESNTFVGTWVLKDCLDRLKQESKALLCYSGQLKEPKGYDKKVLSAKNEIEVFLKQN